MSVRFLLALGLAIGLLATPPGVAHAQSRPDTPSPPPPSPSATPRETPRDIQLPADRSRPAAPPGTPSEPTAVGLRTIAGPTCSRPGDLVMVEGRGLDAARGYVLLLELPAERLSVTVVAWQGSRLIARLPDDPRLVGGQRYRLILTDQRGRAVGEPPSVFLDLCPVIQQADGTSGGQQDAAVPGEVTVLLSGGGIDPEPVITQLGYGIAQRVQLAALGQEILRLAVPSGKSVPQALNELRTALPGAVVDANSLYDLQATPRLYARGAIGWPENAFECAAGGQGGRLGLIDGGLDPRHPALAGQDIIVRSFLEKGDMPASPDHATGIAAILVGKPGADVEGGLLPAARLYAAEVFRRRAGGADQTSTLTVVLALNWMAEESLRVVNLSFAGPRNDVLSATLAQASRQGMILIAASGNNGPAAAPAYPAADESLIAVTALDAAHRLYGAANRGDYIDFAAPGVDIWTARAGGGGAYRSGTSFAAPYVAAVVVAELALNPRLSAGLLKEGLRRRAQDLGPAGKDPGFGWGLVRAPVACAG